MNLDPAWLLPGPGRFLDQVADDLREGGSVIVGPLGGCPSDLQLNLAERLEYEHWKLPIHTVNVTPSSNDTPPAVVLMEVVGISGHPSRSADADALFGKNGVPPHIYWIDGADAALCSEPWRLFLRRFADIARPMPVAERPRLVFPVAEALDRYAAIDDVIVRLRDWHETGHAHDVAMYSMLRVTASNAPGAHNARDLLMHLVAELAGSDFGVADRLVSRAIDRLLDPMSLLAEIGREHLGMGPSDAQKVLAEGVASPTLAALAGEERPVMRAVWRAQMRSLFPLLEERRTEIVASAPPWLKLPFHRNDHPPITDAYELELAHLFAMLRRSRNQAPLLDELQVLVELRNQLAHMRPCPAAWLRRPAVRHLINLDGVRCR
jgi:hypothetical protein